MTTKAPVYLFNGYSDVSVQFDGKTHRFPYNSTTKVEDQVCRAPDEAKRNHESDPDPGATLEKVYEARPFVELLFTRHNQNLLGDKVVWLGDREPNAEEKKACLNFGRIKKMKQVEEALSERQAALQKGGRPELDVHIVLWMQEFGVHDPTYNPAPPTDVGKDLVAALREVLASQNQQPQLAGARK
jgi:hypothetical protein